MEVGPADPDLPSCLSHHAGTQPIDKDNEIYIEHTDIALPIPAISTVQYDMENDYTGLS